MPTLRLLSLLTLILAPAVFLPPGERPARPAGKAEKGGVHSLKLDCVADDERWPVWSALAARDARPE